MRFHQEERQLDRSEMMDCVTHILGEKCAENHRNRLASNVFVTNFICGNIRRVLRLIHATHMTLGQLYQYVTRYNEWFRGANVGDEYQLVQQQDLTHLLGYEMEGTTRSWTLFKPVDIRCYFKPVSVSLAGVINLKIS